MAAADGFSETEELAEKRNLEGNCETLRTSFSQGQHSPIYKQVRRGLFIFNPRIDFCNVLHRGKNKLIKKKTSIIT